MHDYAINSSTKPNTITLTLLVDSTFTNMKLLNAETYIF